MADIDEVLRLVEKYVGDDAAEDIRNYLNVDRIEKILFRRVVERRLEGYTLETAREIAQIGAGRVVEIDKERQARIDRLDAQRYRKLKADMSTYKTMLAYLNIKDAEQFDAAVDALPEPKP